VISSLTGVYHADGSLLGELRYVVGSRLGRTHCALCDITHGRLREKAEWRAQRDRLGVPFRAVHLDERTPEERAASEGRTPCVLAHTPDGIHVLLDSDALEACHGDPAALAAAIERALAS
jgi:GAF domain-containing protein